MNFAKKITILNKRASFEYSFIEKFTAGLQLQGTEIKSIRLGKANITDAYCVFVAGELVVRNMEIAPYDGGTYYNHAPRRDRKLLLNKHELKKISNSLKDKGLTVIPLKLFINDGGFAKLEVVIAKGKKLFDKRADIKERELKRELARKIRV